MILERLKEYIDYKRISIAAFEKSVGMSNASFGKSLKNGGAIGTDKLENILIIYSDINPVWLLTGEGSMLKEEQVQEEASINTVDTSFIYNMYKDYKNMQDSLNFEIKELHAKIEKQNDTIIALVAEKKDLEVRLGILDPLQLPPVGDVLQKKSLSSQIQPIASVPVRTEKGKSSKI